MMEEPLPKWIHPKDKKDIEEINNVERLEIQDGVPTVLVREQSDSLEEDIREVAGMIRVEREEDGKLILGPNYTQTLEA